MRLQSRFAPSARALRALAYAVPILALLGGLCTVSPAVAQLDFPEADKASIEVAAGRTAYEPGATARLVVKVSVEPGWHVNSHKPTFEYLIPTDLDLELPAGWPAERVDYPEGEMQKFAFETELLSVYDGEFSILADVPIPEGTAAGKFPVKAALSYQSCDDRQCLPPTTAEATAEITVGPGGAAAPGLAAPEGGTAAEVEQGAGGQAEVETAAPGSEAEPGAEAGAAGAQGGGGEGPATGTGVQGTEEAGGAAAARPGRQGIALMLLLALGGGLILNVMPCVLPVLSLKVFGMVRSAAHGRREVVRGSLATAAGILVSFWALAAAAIAAKAAGAAVGWGVQFQRPGFVALLALVVVLFCLNLWGLFEIALPASLARLGGSGPREGMAGHFVSGLFATLMATPCSAPFLGTAVGFALAQEAPVIVAIFTAVGVGMALPYLLLALAPDTARLLPRPGAWMEQVRGVMGFLLAAAAVWLFYVLSRQVSPETLALVQLALLGLALFAWLRHRAGGAGVRRLAAGGMVAAALGTVVLALGLAGTGGIGGMGSGGVVASGAGAGGGAATGAKGLIEWIPFDRRQAEDMAASGKLVFVDVTADWCFTCKVNERLVLETNEVAGVFSDHAVVAMKADWTNRNDTIAKYLAEHGRYGIPFYVLYRPGEAPHVFSELLTKGDVVEAVKRAGARQVAAEVPEAPAAPPAPAAY